MHRTVDNPDLKKVITSKLEAGVMGFQAIATGLGSDLILALSWDSLL